VSVETPLINRQNQNSAALFRPLAADAPLVSVSTDRDYPGDLAWALGAFRARQSAYALYHAYYDGRHNLAFAARDYREAFRSMLAGLRCNICPRVVHATTDRLKLTGFAAHDTETRRDSDGQHAAHKAAALSANVLWQDARLDSVENRIYTEAVTTGSAYLLIWPDADEPTVPRFYLQSATDMVARYDSERPDTLTVAAKLWQDGKRYRMNLYYDDEIRKYTTADRANLGGPERASAFKPLEGADAVVRHDYGRVPVFPFPFDATMAHEGRAELHDLIPLQDALNKALADTVVASEFAAFRQRYAIGVSDDGVARNEKGEVMLDAAGKPLPSSVQVGMDRLITVANVNAKFGEFAATDLRPYLDTINTFFALAAQIKGIPLHTLTMSGDVPSGEALKTLEGPLVARVNDTQTDFGDVWEDALAFALAIQGTPDAHLTALWRPAETRAEMETINAVVAKVRDAAVPIKQGWVELGYSEQQIKELVTQRQDEQARAVESFDRTLNLS